MTVPFAHQLRPQELSEFHGQQHLLNEESSLTRVLRGGALHSMIFWGPPGTGKTTLASMLAHTHQADFVSMSAVSCGVKEIRKVVEAAAQSLQGLGRQTVLFLDEVHRFNKSQQDAFLPHIENGTIIFVGATTENPSFALNNALLSRARVYVLKSLETQDIEKILHRARELVEDSQIVSDEHIKQLAVAADGDARKAIGLFELLAPALAEVTTDSIDQVVADVISGTQRRFDRGGDDFYDQISALHKSVRGSDPDAALYWLCRMLDGGCDARYLSRRLVRMASEDIGNADPRALWIVSDCCVAFERLGSPEGDLALAQATIYLACAPKSNAVYMAFNKAMADVRTGGSRPVPEHLRNAPTELAKSMGHGAEYKYAHDYPGAFVPDEHYFPNDMDAQRYYHPVSRGLETQIASRLEELRQLNKQKSTRKK